MSWWTVHECIWRIPSRKRGKRSILDGWRRRASVSLRRASPLARSPAGQPGSAVTHCAMARSRLGCCVGALAATRCHSHRHQLAWRIACGLQDHKKSKGQAPLRRMSKGADLRLLPAAAPTFPPRQTARQRRSALRSAAHHELMRKLAAQARWIPRDPPSANEPMMQAADCTPPPPSQAGERPRVSRASKRPHSSSPDAGAW